MAEKLDLGQVLQPTTFLGALTVFVVGSLIVRAVWPASRRW